MTMIRTSRLLAAAASLLAAMALQGCMGDHPITGTWRQRNAVTHLPTELGGDPIDIDATLVLDGHASPGTFDLTLDLSYMSALSDHVLAHGTWVTQGGNLDLTFTGFTIDPASGNVASVDPATGAQCIALSGFGNVSVCFPVPQGHPYTLGADTLGITLDQTIGGYTTPSTSLSLIRQ
jgi:hypothetical protein